MKKIIWLSVFVLAVLMALVVLGTVAASAGYTGLPTYSYSYYTYTVTGGEATIQYVDDSISGDITIPSTLGGYPVTGIGPQAFHTCRDLTEVFIPACITNIKSHIFDACGNLTKIIVDPSNPVYHSEGNCLIETATKTLIDGCGASVIPEDGSVTSIASGAFFDDFNLYYIAIPDTVTKIGDFAFCFSGLYSVHIPSSVITIGDGAFDRSDLEYISFDKNSQLETIGSEAFSFCELSEITIPASVKSVGAGAFNVCESLEKITFLSPYTEIYCDISVSVTIHGYEGSTAHIYAETYGRTFVALDSYTEGLEFTLSADEKSYDVTGYKGTATSIVVPNIYYNLPVTVFAKNVFQSAEYDDEITSSESGAIVLPEDSLMSKTFVEQITFLSRSITIEDDADTIPAGVTVCGYMNSTAHQYALKYGREFIVLPEIASANIALGSDITVNYLAYLDDSQKDAVMKFTVNGVTTEVAGVATATPNRYQYSFTGINPQMMGDNIAVELVLNGETLAAIDTYSVKQYCVNMKVRVESKSITGFSDAQYAVLDTLLADILEYGAAAQTYVGYNVDALVNEGITGASEFVTLGDEHRMPAFDVTTVPGYSFSAAQVELSNVIRLYFGFTAADISRVTIKVGELIYDQDDFTVKTVTDGFGVSSTVYELRSEPIFANQMETSYTVILLVDGVECQRLQYSVVNYIYNMQNTTTDPNLVALLKRIRSYGLSAVAYRDAK